MRQDRIVLPIPPGAHWKSEMPIFVPEVQNALPAPKEARAPKAQKTAVLMPPTRRRVQFGCTPTAPAPEPVLTVALGRRFFGGTRPARVTAVARGSTSRFRASSRWAASA